MLQQKGTIIFHEISQQPEAWQDVVRVLNEKRQDLAAWFRQEAFSQVMFMGCGSSYNASIVSSKNFMTMTGVTSAAFPSSEVFSSNRLPYDDRRKTLLVVFSRSGQSSETIWAIDRIKEVSKNTKILCICPYHDSEMLVKADKTLILEKAKEESPVTSKAFTSFIFSTKLLTGILLQNMNFLTELTKVPALFDLKKYQTEIQKICSAKFTQVIFCASGSLYGLACEGSLFVKKISTTPAEAYHTLELRHGNAVHGNLGTLIVNFASDNLKKGEGIAIGELAALKSPRMVICEEADSRLGMSDYVFELKTGLSELARDMLMMPIAQLLGFYLTIAKGYNPDKPKHVIPVIKWKESFH